MNLQITSYYKLAAALVVLLALAGSIRAQLPPIFDPSAYSGIQVSELTTTYLPPTRIVWKEAKGNAQIVNEHYLLQKGIGQADLGSQHFSTLKSDQANTPSIILDFGRELHGGIQIVTNQNPTGQPVKLRIRFGESVSETMADPGDSKGATNDHAIRDAILEVPWWGIIEFGNTGFRFVRIDLVEPDTEIRIDEIRAKFIYQDIPYLGSFKSNDELLNEIWMTGAYTVHLNLQDYLWDGIKRDRLVWIGDIHPEVSTVNSVFGYNASVPRSLDLARDNTPLPGWMNGQCSYSLWWIITHKDWYMQNGDLAYLQQQKEYLGALLRRLFTMIDSNGQEKLSGGVRFLDWPSSENPEAIHAGLQALMVWALTDAREMCLVLNEKELADACNQAVAQLKRYTPEANGSKQAGALLGVTGLVDSREANRIVSHNGVENFSTFYGYYMLQAMAKAGNYETALESIRQYWGGMLSVGATTFWEDFDINWLNNASRIDEIPRPGKVDIHSTYGDYCYKGLRHSLCHGWASGPTAWLSEHVLGIQILEPGCKTIKIAPNLGDLEFAEGTYPTPLGIVRVKHVKQPDGSIHSEIDAPEGIRIIQ
ncbi:MAG: alpha-L-rhamnosidase [Tannerellaceae bacterium]|nr:alpha-L-rhamnosidase [Tannerellaceae bacterium]